jgi:hypothetical protein
MDIENCPQSKEKIDFTPAAWKTCNTLVAALKES